MIPVGDDVCSHATLSFAVFALMQCSPFLEDEISIDCNDPTLSSQWAHHCSLHYGTCCRSKPLQTGDLRGDEFNVFAGDYGFDILKLGASQESFDR